MGRNRDYPKRNLGQNFLIDKNIVNKIMNNLDISGSDTVLEIGAGRGELTGLIAARVRDIWAIELDHNLFGILSQRLMAHKNINLIKQDILSFNIDKCITSKKRIKVIGNIPYYIASDIIRYLIKARDKIESMYITVQKEHGEKLVASLNQRNYGSLSCFVQYFTEPKILFFIKNKSFWPAPKVDSCFLRMKIRGEPAVQVADEVYFFRIIRSSFAKRRKTLKNSLQGIVAAKKLEKFFKDYSIDPKIRPQSLSLQDFARLANY